eukprot:tig00021290_g19956.t1
MCPAPKCAPDHPPSRAVHEDDFTLISTGGADLCVMQWKHTWTGMPRDEEEEDTEMRVNYNTEMQSGADDFAIGIDEGKDEQFGAVKPWVGTINALVPDSFMPDPKLKQPPTDELTLEFDDGNASEIVYHAAALGIVYDKGTHTQKKAPINIWDARIPEKPIATLQGHQRGVPCLSFSRDGAHLVSVGLDDNHMVIVWDWKAKKKLGENKGGPDRVFNVDCSPHADGEFITTGAKHIKFWSGGPARPAGKLGSVKGKGMTDQKAYHAVAWLDASTVVAGTTDGALYKFLLSGGKDGAICVFATQDLGSGSTPAKRIDLNKQLSSDPTASVTALAPALRALSVKGNKCLAGLMSSTIVEVDIRSGSVSTLLAAHGASGTRMGKAADYQGEIWGLGIASGSAGAAQHPSKNEYVTCSDDCLLRFWDVASRKCTKAIRLEAPGRSACFSPDGAHVAVGLYTGDLEVFDARRGERICKRPTGAGKIAKEELGELKYSPDGKYLAVGSSDNGIYVFSVVKDYKLAGRCKGHSSYVRHLDWNEGSTAIQSDCGAYELLFWSIPSCKQNSKASSFKNEKWATQSCVIGWPVQGVFEPGMDGLDVKRARLGVNGADGASQSQRKKYKGHSEHVTNVRWTPRDDYLISTGGADLCVMQWSRLKAIDDSWISTEGRLSLANEGRTEWPTAKIAAAGPENIRVLDLSRNQLTSIPGAELAKLTNLEVLRLDNNKLTALPPEIGRLATLKELYVRDNQLTVLPPEIGRLAALEALSVIDNKLAALPPEIGRLAALKELGVSGNQLTALPPEIGCLAALKKLDVGGNQLTALPPEIGQLTNLQEMDVSSNQLTTLPPEAGRLAALQWLNVGSNQLEQLPSGIWELAQLQKLYANGNQLKALPPEIGRLKRLQQLCVDFNQLNALPPEIGHLAALRELSVSNNELITLPPEMGRLENLEQLYLKANPLTAMPQHTRESGPSALAHLRALALAVDVAPSSSSSAPQHPIPQQTSANEKEWDCFVTQQVEAEAIDFLIRGLRKNLRGL